MSGRVQCPACGSSLADRARYVEKNTEPADNISTDLTDCPHCGSKKCAMCDMGDDVRCLSCEGSDHD